VQLALTDGASGYDFSLHGGKVDRDFHFVKSNINKVKHCVCIALQQRTN